MKWHITYYLKTITGLRLCVWTTALDMRVLGCAVWAMAMCTVGPCGILMVPLRIASGSGVRAVVSLKSNVIVTKDK